MPHQRPAFMRFTSLIVELVRARPLLVFWLVALAQAALWFILPLVIYSSPPGDVAFHVAIGREYLLSGSEGPPLAYWLADIAFRLAGNHMFGVYLLAQVCLLVALLALFRLGRAIVGAQHAAIAILLTVTITAFSFPNLDFGPDVLAQPLWALTLLSAWRIMGQGHRGAWFALAIAAGLLLLTTHSGLLLLGLLAAFALANARGRRALGSFDALFALAVLAVLFAPYAIVWSRGGVELPFWRTNPSGTDGVLHAVSLAGGLVLALSGIALLALMNMRRLDNRPAAAPSIFRPPVDPFAQQFVFFFALAPPVFATLTAAITGNRGVAGGAGTALLLCGLAVVVAAGDLLYLRRQRLLRLSWAAIVAAPAVFILGVTLIQPWIFADEVKTARPARAIGEFFGENYQRRTGQPLRAVAGDAELAGLIAFAAPSRPHLMLDAALERTPWLTPANFNATGGVIVWRASDTAGAPPPEIARRFPGLVPEVPRAFQRAINGRQPLLRVGWAIVRPASVPR